MARPLCISTLDLAYFQHGGVVNMALMFARLAREEGFDPFFMSPSLPLHRTLKRTLNFHFPPAAIETTFEGFLCWQMGALYPEFEHNAHRFNKAALQKILAEPLPCFSISGNNHAALPFSMLSMPYTIWAASTYWEDCRHRIARTPFSIRKLLDTATRPSCELLEQRLFAEAQQVAVLTRYTLRHVPRQNTGHSRDVKIIPVPVDCEAYRPASAPARSTLVFVGRLSDPRKNLDLLLNAFTAVSPAIPDLRLRLIGMGDDEILQKLARHPFRERINWQKGISESEKIACIQNALALVISSYQEGYGITGTEAMACGVPVISTRCGGTEDYVIPGENGFLLQGFDASEMSDAILRLAKDPALQQRLARQSREYVLKHLSIRAIRPLLQNLIHNR